MKMQEGIICSLILLVILFFIGPVVYKTWSLGSSEKDYTVVCIGGHEYYRANFANKGFLGIRLHSNGMPVKCEKR